MILLIDNYDSFTYNLYQAVGVLTKDITVARNDEITIEEIEKMSPAAIIISPGSWLSKGRRNFRRGHKDIQRQDPYTWRLSRTPGDSRSIRWKDSSRKTAASRQADRYQS